MHITKSEIRPQKWTLSLAIEDGSFDLLQEIVCLRKENTLTYCGKDHCCILSCTQSFSPIVVVVDCLYLRKHLS